MAIAKKYNLKVVEDAAQGVDAFYKGKALGTIGDFGCYSFHETKNYTMGEGGAILFNNDEYQEKAEILREKGTDRSKFFRGQVDKYRWMDYGSSYLPSELNAAYLYAQLEEREKIFNIHIKKRRPQDLKNIGVKELVSITDGFSGADIEGVVKDAIESAFAEDKTSIQTADVIDAIKDTHSLSEIMKDALEKMTKEYESRKFKSASK